MRILSSFEPSHSSQWWTRPGSRFTRERNISNRRAHRESREDRLCRKVACTPHGGTCTPSTRPRPRSSCTGVVASRTELREGEPALHRRRPQSLARGAVAQLAVKVVGSPVVGPVRGGLPAGVVDACSRTAEGEPTGNSPRPEAEIGLAVAQLSVSAIAPAKGSVGVEAPAVRLIGRGHTARYGGPKASTDRDCFVGLSETDTGTSDCVLGEVHATLWTPGASASLP
jgi:hypothetical protein